MRASGVLAIFYVFMFSACGSEEGINPAEESLDFFVDAKLTGEFPFAFSGDNVVFHRHYTREDDKAIADDEYSEDFFVELENPGESFEYAGEELKDLKTLFLYYCYCGYTTDVALKEGSIKGIKKSARKYELDVDVTYEYYHIDQTSKDTIETYTRQVKYKGIHQQDAVPSGMSGAN
jgi:hypothetical protein